MCSEMGEQRVAWQSRQFWSRKLKKNNKGTGTGRALLGEEQAHESELWSEEDCAWWSKGKRCKTGFSEGNESFRKGGVLALTDQRRVQAVISTRTKARARIKKEKAREVLILNLDFQPRKHLVKKDIAIRGNQKIGFPAYLTIPLVQVFVELLHGVAPNSETNLLGSL